MRKTAHEILRLEYGDAPNFMTPDVERVGKLSPTVAFEVSSGRGFASDTERLIGVSFVWLTAAGGSDRGNPSSVNRPYNLFEARCFNDEGDTTAKRLDKAFRYVAALRYGSARPLMWMDAHALWKQPGAWTQKGEPRIKAAGFGPMTGEQFEQAKRDVAIQKATDQDERDASTEEHEAAAAVDLAKQIDPTFNGGTDSDTTIYALVTHAKNDCTPQHACTNPNDGDPCTFCRVCGRCREDVDDDDVCPRCLAVGREA